MDTKDIRQLIDKFLNGNTTNAEEQQLYDYFTAGHVADELKDYRQMFEWYAERMPEDKLPQQRRLSFTTLHAPLLRVAASLLLLVGLGLGYWQYQRYQRQQQEYAIYEGSYIVRNGQKITNLKVILPILKAAEQEAMDAQNRQKTDNQNIPTI